MQKHNNWWYTLNEQDKQKVWYNEVVTKWWSDLSIGDKRHYLTRLLALFSIAD